MQFRNRGFKITVDLSDYNLPPIVIKIETRTLVAAIATTGFLALIFTFRAFSGISPLPG